MTAAPPPNTLDIPDAMDGVDTTELLATLARWGEAGWLRRLDVALARWLHAECPDAPPELLLAAALLAQREGRGHSCIRLDELLAPPRSTPVDEADETWLDGPPPAQAELRALLARLGGDAAQWDRRLAACAAVDAGHAAAVRGQAPLVLEAGRLYLRRHWREEEGVATSVRARLAARAADDESGEATPDPAQVRHWLETLFNPTGAQVDPLAPVDPAAPMDWQRAACAMALRGRLAILTGGPGTGKTYTVARFLALVAALHPDLGQLRIALAAPTGKAAARLKQSIDLALQSLRAQLPGALDWDTLAARLAQALTLHKLLGARPDTRRLRHDARHPLEVDLLVVDEASMVHLELMAALLDALPLRARLLLLGDKDQLASVEAGAVLGDLCADAEAGRYSAETAAWIEACTGRPLPTGFLAANQPAGVPETEPAPALAQQTVMLRESRRFQGAIGELARAVNAGDGAAALATLAVPLGQGARSGDLALLSSPDPQALLRLALDGRPGAEGGYGPFLAALGERPLASAGQDAHADWVRAVLGQFDRFRLLCALREGDWGVAGLNRAIEQALRARGALGRTAGPGAASLGSEWYEGRPVMVTRNDSALGVFNGDVGVALRSAPVPGSGRELGALRVWFADGDQLRSVLASRLAAVETAWAMTVHKSQGSEFHHTVLVLPPHDSPVATRELVYTGITRAREAFTLVAPDPAAFVQAVRRRTRRASGLPMRLARPD